MGTLFDVNLQELLAAHGALPASAASQAAPVPPQGPLAAHPLVAARAADAVKSASAARLEPGRYFTFIRIDIRHSFFNRTNGVCDQIAIRPTSATARQLALFGLVARPRPDGIDILWASGLRDRAVAQLRPFMEHIAGLPPAEGAQMAEALGQELFGQALFFTISLSNPLFANFTDMPSGFRIGDPPLLLSNRAAERRPGKDCEADLIVKWEKRAGRGAPATAPPARASWAINANARAEKAQSGAPLVATGIASGSGGQKPIETRSRRFALLDLYLVRAADAAPAPGQWDGMPISLDPGVNLGDHGEGIFHPCVYTLTFKARETRWRYFVAARSGELNTDGLAVVGPDGADARFAMAPEPRLLPDGRHAACLASLDPLPILARPNSLHRFSLCRRPAEGRARPRMLVDPLPAAGIESISPEPPQVWSDIYVFV